MPPFSRARVRPSSGAWIVFGVVYSTLVVVSMAMFVVPPLLPVLMTEFGVDLAAASTLMSIFSITGIVLALPAGALLARLGAHATGLAAVGSVVIGCLLGALAPSFGLLLASRAIQGVGVGLFGVVAPATVAVIFPRERQGVLMGVLATAGSVAGLLTFTFVPRLEDVLGWRSALYAIAGIALATFFTYRAAMGDFAPVSAADSWRRGSRAAPGALDSQHVVARVGLSAGQHRPVVDLGTPANVPGGRPGARDGSRIVNR